MYRKTLCDTLFFIKQKKTCFTTSDKAFALDFRIVVGGSLADQQLISEMTKMLYSFSWRNEKKNDLKIPQQLTNNFLQSWSWHLHRFNWYFFPSNNKNTLEFPFGNSLRNQNIKFNRIFFLDTIFSFDSQKLTHKPNMTHLNFYIRNLKTWRETNDQNKKTKITSVDCCST